MSYWFFESPNRNQFIQHCASPRLLYFVGCYVGNSPGWWADTVANYYPSRPSCVKNKNITKYGEWGVAQRCTSGWENLAILRKLFLFTEGNSSFKQDMYSCSRETNRAGGNRKIIRNFEVGMYIRNYIYTLWGVHSVEMFCFVFFLEVPVTN